MERAFEKQVEREREKYATVVFLHFRRNPLFFKEEKSLFFWGKLGNAR